MMDLKFITENPLIKTLALGKLKKVFSDNGVKLITVSPDENGELDFQTFAEEMVVMKRSDFTELILSLNNNSKS